MVARLIVSGLSALSNAVFPSGRAVGAMDRAARRRDAPMTFHVGFRGEKQDLFVARTAGPALS